MTPKREERRRIVVDGSNIATEGRTLPSLAQLDEAIRSFLEEYQGFSTQDVTVVVDASFGHRIDPSEVAAFEQAVDHGEMITPPAGAVGRGDGFILRIAEKSGALVLSNDSFQEFHAERPWLFEPGRLIGGKPVAGVGWVFTPRTPVRGVRSRSVTRSKRDGSSAREPSEDAEDRANGTRTQPAKATKSAKTAKAAKVSGPAARTSKVARPVKSAEVTEASGGGAGPESANTAKSNKAASMSQGTLAAGSTDPVTKAAKTAKAATKTAKDSTAGRTAKAAKSTKASGAVTATKATKTDKNDKSVKATKATKATKAGKATKATKATKVGKATKAIRAGKAVPAPGAGDVRTTDGDSTAPALNDPVTFLTFVADHPVGSTFEGTVVSFTSHGAHVEVGGMLCHVPLRGLADPPPNRARQVLTKGETRQFVLVSLDAARRRAELALPGMAKH